MLVGVVAAAGGIALIVVAGTVSVADAEDGDESSKPSWMKRRWFE